MLKGIFGKLLLMNLIVIGVTLLVIALLMSQLVSGYIFSQKEKELTAKGREVGQLMLDYIEDEIDEDTALYLLSSLDGFLDARIWMVDREGLVVMASYGSRQFRRGPGFRMPEPDNMTKILKGESTTTKHYVPHFEETMLSVGVPIQRDGNFSEVEGAILLHAPVTEIGATVARLRQFTGMAGLGALILASLLGYFYSLRLSGPLRKMSDTALKMAGGEFSSPVQVNSDDEIGQLGSSLNYLSSRLDQTINELKQEKYKFASMVTGMQEGVMSVNHGGQIAFLNSAAAKLLDIKEDFVGLPLNDVFSDHRIIDTFRRVLEKGQSALTVIDYKSFILSLRISPVQSESGDHNRSAVALIQDISESEKLEKMRKEFIANVSHELRTPLTTISGFTGSLLDGTVTDPKSRDRYLGIISEESRRMSRLIENLLDLSRLESGRMKMDKQPFSLKEVVEVVVNRLQPLMEDKNVTVHIGLEDIPPVLADRDRIEQVIYNLVENAIRYVAHEGKVYIGATRCEDTKKINAYVKDTGTGIPPDELPFIWDRFHRVEKSRSRRKGGTGLGLSIIKQIIEAHGEDIIAKNDPEGGAVFTFSLPFIKQESE